jgi:hypothetical protein
LRVGSYIPVLLSQVTSLEKLRIDIFHASDIEPEVWINIDQQLNRPQLANLLQVNLSVDSSSDRRTEDSILVKDKLPLTVARGVVHFLLVSVGIAPSFTLTAYAIYFTEFRPR